MWDGFQTAVRLIYPARCLGCGDMVESDFGLCGACWGQTAFISGTVCDACGAPVIGPSDGARIECDDCKTYHRPWSTGRSALIYEDLARKLVLGLKHGDRTEIAKPAALWMRRVAEPILSRNMLLAPVPLHRTRLLKRRYNQSALLASAISHETGFDHCPDLLIRALRTPKLERASVRDRYSLLAEAIRTNPRQAGMMQGRSVLLVDDVMTSGATLTACTLACLKSGARDVSVVTLARRCKSPAI